MICIETEQISEGSEEMTREFFSQSRLGDQEISRESIRKAEGERYLSSFILISSRQSLKFLLFSPAAHGEYRGVIFLNRFALVGLCDVILTN
jgi:hypothetical protein